MPQFPLEDLKKDLEIKTKFLGEDFIFHTTWGLFSPEKIDEGTIALIKSIKLPLDADILDMGCGYGPVGLALAKKTSGEVLMVDKDFVAVDYANKNAKLNKIKNAKAVLSNGFSHVEGNKKFDLIISNLPAKVSKEFFWILFGEAKDHLKKDGKIVVVTIAGLEFFIKKNFEKVFGNYELMSQGNGYFVACAQLK
ncbi:MAG: rRNA (guanine1207-N2)-methyltransferase [Patescibacteria group bacterium]|jgi:16S rRNA G1207 methylase RsmC|nr:rRNA (guanine1207-N2)-methyltransferase [Patescibacteria group bacterium]